MSGFEIRNNEGAITVNSDFTSPRLQRRITSPRWDIGYFDMDIPGIGNLNVLRDAYETVGNTFVDWHQPGQIVWCRFAVGGGECLASTHTRREKSIWLLHVLTLLFRADISMFLTVPEALYGLQYLRRARHESQVSLKFRQVMTCKTTPFQSPLPVRLFCRQICFRGCCLRIKRA